MSESLVDLTYRGLALGRRVKLTQVRPTTGYLELPTPMPVGTAIGIATDEGVLASAIVTEVHEQVSGSEHVPGMLVQPMLDGDAARAWWAARVTLPELGPAAAPSVATVRPKRGTAVPELVDDGNNTTVMEAVEPPAESDAASSTDGLAGEPGLRPIESEQPAGMIVDDGKRTIAMAVVDLEALGLDPAASTSGAIPVMNDGDDELSNPADSKPNGSAPRRKRKRR